VGAPRHRAAGAARPPPDRPAHVPPRRDGAAGVGAAARPHARLVGGHRAQPRRPRRHVRVLHALRGRVAGAHARQAGAHRGADRPVRGGSGLRLLRVVHQGRRAAGPASHPALPRPLRRQRARRRRRPGHPHLLPRPLRPLLPPHLSG
ncbi:hypothetical protein KEM52_005000, partial [Ascosphaera acerosa]